MHLNQKLHRKILNQNRFIKTKGGFQFLVDFAVRKDEVNTYNTANETKVFLTMLSECYCNSMQAKNKIKCLFYMLRCFQPSHHHFYCKKYCNT